jgi:hypothetical protein
MLLSSAERTNNYIMNINDQRIYCVFVVKSSILEMLFKLVFFAHSKTPT